MPTPITAESNAELEAAAKNLSQAEKTYEAAKKRLNDAILPYVGNESIPVGRYVLVPGSPIHLVVKDASTAAVEETPLLTDVVKPV